MKLSKVTLFSLLVATALATAAVAADKPAGLCRRVQEAAKAGKSTDAIAKDLKVSAREVRGCMSSGAKTPASSTQTH